MSRNARLASLAMVLMVSAAALAAGGCALKEARLLVVLPDYVNTPDGMALMPDNSIILSVPNFNDPTSPAVLVKISPDNSPTCSTCSVPAARTSWASRASCGSSSRTGSRRTS
ncbi:MAG: hypothetical protein NTU94_13175 [Planctomycetota bacterium]|nr:hypothetical protein [Planctomycetota bacterium]